jgi:hypothetical protein
VATETSGSYGRRVGEKQELSRVADDIIAKVRATAGGGILETTPVREDPEDA